MNEYLKLVEDAQKKRIDLTTDQVNSIRNLYSEVAINLLNKSKSVPENSLTERWLRDYSREFRREVRRLNETLLKQITDSMNQGAEYATGIQSQFFDMMNDKFELNQSFKGMFSKIPRETVQELVNGDFYKDGKGLSKRIWHNENKANADFDYIIQKGLLEKRSVADIAADLAKYVNPKVKNDWDFKKIYPNVGNKKIEYNSMRLAITSISHAYQLSMKRSCKANPYVDEIEWHTSGSHRRTCELCKSRDGLTFPIDKLPLDHPNGICYFTPVLSKSLEDIGTELKNWVNGGPNEKLDKLYKNSGVTEPPKKDSINLAAMKSEFERSKAKGHWKTVEKMIENSPDFIQKFFSKFNDKLKFDTVRVSEGAWYSFVTGGISTNMSRDKVDVRGQYSTFFHEFGHLLDDHAKQLIKIDGKYAFLRPSGDQRFISAIQEDYQDRLNTPLLKGKPQTFINGKLTDMLRAEGNLASGVHDAYSGLTLNKVRGGWGHDTEYWLRSDVEKEVASETFANMTAAYTNPEILPIMKKWFPKSCDVFETLVNEALEIDV